MRRPWYRARIDGTARAIMGEPTQNEALGQLTTALDFELWDQPSLTTGMSVDLYQIEQEAATITAQFAGVVNHVAGQSSPNHVLVTCTGPLAKLRRTTPADVNLSGMTDGEAVEYVLTACGITFTASDIQDAGYVLGAQTPVFWRQDTPGSEVVRALDEVLGMETMEIGAGRVCRVAYDLAPDAADAYATWERDVTADYFLGERNFGDLDAIQNVWQVRGATWTDEEGCQLTPWARAESTHPKLGAGVYVRTRTFSSEIIQDEALAGAVVRRLMRWHNREPDEFRLEAVNDPNVVKCRVVGAIDPVYGINLASSAKPYTVTGVDRRGDRMIVRGVGGPAGAEGTVTTGVQRMCNQAEFDFDLPGSFIAPTFSLPPLLTVGAYDLNLDGFPVPEFGLPSFGVGVYTSGGGSGTGLSGAGSDPQEPAPASCEDCAEVATPQARAACEAEFCAGGVDLLGDAYIDRWVSGGSGCAQPGTTTQVLGILTVSDGECGYHEDLDVDVDADWRLSATAEVDSAAVGNFNGSIGITTSVSFSAGANATILSFLGGDSTTIGNSAESDVLDPTPFAIDDPFDVTLERSGASVAWQIEQGASSWSGAIAWDGPPDLGLGLRLFVHADGGDWQFTGLAFELL